MNSVNTCGSSFSDQSELSLDSYVAMSGKSFDADVGDLIDMEPMVYKDDCALFSNIDISNTNDYNRLTCASHPEQDATGNYGYVMSAVATCSHNVQRNLLVKLLTRVSLNNSYGLGTLYDARHDENGDGLTVGVCPSLTMRPLCDAQLHTNTTNWGSASGMGGMIGTDNDCNNGCPWTKESGFVVSLQCLLCQQWVTCSSLTVGLTA